MKFLPRSSRLLASLAVIAAVVAVSALIGTQGANAGVSPQPFHDEFGMVGITKGQMAILNTVNVTPGKVTVRLRFFDGEGKVIAHAREVLRKGEATSLSLSFSDSDTPRGVGRLQIRAGVLGVDETAGFISTLEIVNAETLETQVLVYPPDPVHPPNPI